MRTTKTWASLILVCLMLAVLIPACSDKTFTTELSPAAEDAAVTQYLPLEQGYRINYMIYEPTQQNIQLEIKEPTKVLGNSGYKVEWKNRTSGAVQYFYWYKNGDEIWETNSLSDPGYCILDGPFSRGHTWNRYDTTSLNEYEDDEDGGGGKEDDYFGKLRTDYAYNTMEIVGFENVRGYDGQDYGQCLKVEWQVAEYSYNYYWYSAGTGLVKFEYGYNPIDETSGHEVAIISNFRKVEY